MEPIVDVMNGAEMPAAFRPEVGVREFHGLAEHGCWYNVRMRVGIAIDAVFSGEEDIPRTQN